MILNLIVHKTDDGYTAEVPTLKGCESWAHDEDTVIKNIIELTAYYLNIESSAFKIDKARGNRTRTVYKLVIDK